MEEKIKNILKKLSGHDYIELTSRGNTAIFLSFAIAKNLNQKKIVLVPDQGGWFTYKKYPKQLGLEVCEIKTDYGLIDLTDLKNKSKDANCIIYSTPAGYFAEQEVTKIFKICKENNCAVILDITGDIGKRCHADFSDIQVCSFGEGKPINLGYGGFISAKDNILKEPEKVIAESKFDKRYEKDLLAKLDLLESRHKAFQKVNKKIKQDLIKYQIIHKDKDGINVIVKFSTEEEKEKIINYCKENNLEYTLCPRYIRVKETAVSIEVKRLE